MTVRQFRSSHEPLSSTPAALRAQPRKSRRVAAAPIALAAIASMLFGATPAQAVMAEATELDKLPKIKGLSRSDAANYPSAQVREDKYTVTEGDTVRSIAVSHGVSTAELLAANGLSWKTLFLQGNSSTFPHHRTAQNRPMSVRASSVTRCSPAKHSRRLRVTMECSPEPS